MMDMSMVDTSGLPTSFGSSRRQYGGWKQTAPISLPENLRRFANHQFSKMFAFRPTQEWKLPNVDELFQQHHWKVDELQEYKAELNDTKNKLNKLNLRRWHEHTRIMNHSGLVVPMIKSRIKPELLTQAWCKLYEILGSFPVVPEICSSTGQLNSVHLCEAPGAFVTALNHYLRTNYPSLKWNWTCNSLNPYYEGNPTSEMISDDRFLVNTLEHWEFGQDWTGNLCSLANFATLVESSQKIGPTMLVTADGSIDCQMDPGEQENLVSSLHYCETVTALHLLSKGGSFVLKMFTIFECMSICLVYLLCCCFEQVQIFKPATSRSGNSECYIICLSYLGPEINQCILSALTTSFETVDKSDFAIFSRNQLPTSFVNQIVKCAKLFKDFQVSALEKNLKTFDEHNQNEVENKTLKKLKRYIAELYIERYNLQPLSENQCIVGNHILASSCTSLVKKRDEEGTFEERRMSSQDPLQRLRWLEHCVQSVPSQWMTVDDVFWIDVKKKYYSLSYVEFTMGKPVDKVVSSKFCASWLISARMELEAKFGFQFAASNLPFYTINKRLDAKENNSVLNLTELDWWCENRQSSKQALLKVKCELDRLSNGATLMIVGYSLLTQFNVGILFLLGHIFHRVGFAHPTRYRSTVVLEGYNPPVDSGNFLGVILDKMQTIDKDKAILAVLPIKILCSKKDFCDCIVAFNHEQLKGPCLEAITKLIDNIDTK